MSSVSGVSSLSNQYQVNWQNNFKQRQQEFNDLGAALQSGDLTGAQAAFSALTQNASTSNQAQTSQQSGTTTGIQADFDALGQALQSGDTDAAKTAYAKIQQDLQNVRGHHHHHHRQAGGSDNTSGNSVTDLLQTTSGEGGSTGSGSSLADGSINITA